MTAQQPFNAILTRPLRMRFDRPSAQTTFQFKGTLRADPDDSKDVWSGAINLTLKWIKSRYPEAFPEAAWDGAGFEASLVDERIECVDIPEDGVWSIRWSHPDKPFNGAPAVPGRSWVTGVALAKSDDERVELGVRTQCLSRVYAVNPIALTRPKIVVNLANEFALSEVKEIVPNAWVLNSEAELDELEALITNPQRSLPVYLLTQPDHNRLERKTAPFMLNHTILARRTQGLSYVVAVPWELGFKWTEKIGKPWSAFLGAVRTYMPGLDFDEDSPSAHPLALAERIQWYKRGDSPGIGESEFLEFLVEHALRYSASKPVDWGKCLFLVDARARQAEAARQAAEEDADWMVLYENEILALKKKNAELNRESEAFSDSAVEADKERDYYKDENRKLRAQIDALRLQLAAKSVETVNDSVELPGSYDDIPDWINREFTGQLELHPRAIRALKKAEYEDLPRVCRGIQALAREYRNMKLGYANGQEIWDRKLAELGLRISGSISKSRAGQEGDTYKVVYPPHSSQQRFLDLHLLRGNSREPKRCLRIYFFWHDETKQVIVGSLPGHLDTRIT